MNPRLIYVLGRGHSGSTLITAALGNALQIHSAGELNYKLESVCGCGNNVLDCSFWKEVSEKYDTSQEAYAWQSDMALIRRQAVNFRMLLPLLLGRRTNKFDALKAANERVLTVISDVSGCENILDASKQPLRALFLARATPTTKFIHLVRRPEGYLSSYYQRTMHNERVFFLGRYYNQSRFAPLLLVFMAMSWLAGNLLSELVRFVAPKNFIRVRYEDLTANPHQEFTRIGNFLGLDLSSVIEMVESGELMPTGHIIGGNARVRTEKGFRFQPSAGRERDIPWGYKLLARFFSWPLMLVYGYPIFRESDTPMPPQVSTKCTI